jgi:hypothetical protein
MGFSFYFCAAAFCGPLQPDSIILPSIGKASGPKIGAELQVFVGDKVGAVRQKEYA